MLRRKPSLQGVVGKISDSRENSVSSLRQAARILSASAIATKSRIISAGEVFGDGAIIEPVASSSGQNKPDLLLWDGRKATVGPGVEHGGIIYEAPELPPMLYRATRFASGCREYGSARRLFAAIAELFRRHFDLPDRESSLLASFTVSTWLADRLPSAPALIISGPEPDLGIGVLRLLNCICRYSLLLAELTAGGFRSLPTQLPFTLLRPARLPEDPVGHPPGSFSLTSCPSPVRSKPAPLSHGRACGSTSIA